MSERSRLILYADAAAIEGKKITLSGWAISTLTGDLKFSLYGPDHKKIPFDLKKIRRLDASREILGDESRPECGFKLTFEGTEDRAYTLVVTDGKNRKSNRFLPSGYTLQWKFRPFGLARDYLKRGAAILPTFRAEGAGTFFRQMSTDFRRKEYHYKGYREKRMPSEEELQKQRETVFSYQPKLSLIVPAFRTPKKFLLEMVNSVLEQTYPNLELCIADGSYPETEVAETLAELKELELPGCYQSR